jgi:hypothetical protein
LQIVPVDNAEEGVTWRVAFMPLLCETSVKEAMVWGRMGSGDIGPLTMAMLTA